MKARLDGPYVRLGADGVALHEQSGYGRLEEGGVRLAPEEASYLVHRGRIEIQGYSFDSLVALFAERPNFFRSFLVYRDIRERGYAVQTGPQDFRVFRRGQRPGTGHSQYLVRVLSERDLIDFSVLAGEATSALAMRKQYILAVVDDESELTYYEIKVPSLPPMESPVPGGAAEGLLVGRSAIMHAGRDAPGYLGTFGIRLDEGRVVLSPLEILYLLERQLLKLLMAGAGVSATEYRALAGDADPEFAEKYHAYTYLRERGYIPRTGYKFGHHFRVYSGNKVHSEMLVHALPPGAESPMSAVSRSVRMAHSVKKKMLFACEHLTELQFVEFARIKL
ncbi:tRNA-intron endonuclease [Methanolinea mesophila]|uniref:tRNA-intron lyase n=1 Tax=Methanolinea mesophila TaxID=547055 RepID=UPI001AE6C420|nr:tRNA-intron endonuclease [Methanolinea mesophila]